MCLFVSLIPATLAAALGYFILFSSTRAQGAVKTLGRTLAIWVFVLAALLPVAGGYATYADLCPIGQVMRSMHSGSSSWSQVERASSKKHALARRPGAAGNAKEAI